ncbi:Protein of unknown function [Bacillus mycoides]|nr:Protein of unknown function [Bacillus mycoides]
MSALIVSIPLMRDK